MTEVWRPSHKHLTPSLAVPSNGAKTMFTRETGISQWSEYDPLKLRDEMGWTLERLADELGMSHSVTLKWSSHRRKPGKVARRLAGFVKTQHLVQDRH